MKKTYLLRAGVMVTLAAAVLAMVPGKAQAQAAGPYRERYIAQLLDEDPAMTQIFLGVVQTAWPLLDNTTRAKILMLTRTGKKHGWIRVHHPETQP